MWAEIKLVNNGLNIEDVYLIRLNNSEGPILGTARLEYQIPFHVTNLKETHSFLVYGKRPDQVKAMLVKESGGDIRNCYLDFLIFRWVTQDLLAMSELFQRRWNDVQEQNASQMQINLSL